MAALDKDSPTKIFRSNLYLFFIIFISSGAVISGLLMLFYRTEIDTHLSRLKMQETFSINVQSTAVDHLFDAIVGDLFFISRQNELLAYLADGDPDHLDKVAAEYANISGQKKIYDQIRFFDAEGTERVRINYYQGEPRRVEPDELQFKGKRYYFKDTLELNRGQVFISPFDLNIEQGRIEDPIKPVIRLGTPVFDADGRKRGIVLLNYLGMDLLKRLIDFEKVSEGRTMLLNAAGYWLLSPDSGQEWGFMYNDAQRSFAYAHPDVWETIRTRDEGQVHFPEGLFTFRTLYPLTEGQFSSGGSMEAFGDSNTIIPSREYHWHLVSFIPEKVLTETAAHLSVKLFGFGAGLFVLIASGAWFLAAAITKRRIAQDQLKAMALYDALTELPNRRLFYDRLESTISQCQRIEAGFGLLFIDLDGFKTVNDSLGHEAGDALLVAVAHRLRRCARASDTIARLGGDEFAVIVTHLKSADGADMVASRIIAALSAPVTLPQGDAAIGASIGISRFPANSRDGDELLRQADLAMYQSKRRGKNTYTLFTPDIAGDGG